MGMHRYVYLGPYFEVSVPVTRIRKDMCRHQPESKIDGFCAVCGQALERRFKECDIDVIDIDELGGEDTFVRTPYVTDAPVQAGRRTYYLYPNNTSFGEHLDEDEIAIDVKEIDIQGFLEDFARTYYTNAIRAAVGKGCTFKKCWGLIQRYS